MSHAPKTAALLAYDADLLSPEGDRRVEAHLASCEVCARELASIRAFESLAADVREQTPAAPEWDKIEFSLRREARSQARKKAPGPSRGVAFIALAAAAALAVWTSLPSETPVVIVPGADVVEGLAQAPAPEVPEPEEERLAVVVTAVAGDVLWGSDAESLAVGDIITEGARLVTPADASVHLRLADGTGAVLGSDTVLIASRLRPSGIELTLETGRVASEVATGTPYAVHVDDLRVEVRGTRFEVLSGEATTVRLEEGVVAIVSADGEETLLEAPAVWTRGSGLQALAQDASALPRPRGIALGAATWPTLNLPALADVARWQVDGTDFGAAGRIALRAPTGEIQVTAWDAAGHSRSATITVAAEGGSLAEADLAGETPQAREGHLPREAIQGVVRQGLWGLRRCFNNTLKRRPDLRSAGSYTLRITVGRSGAVSRVRFRGEQPPSMLASCITNDTERWVFPSPSGGAVTFDLPVNLTARQR